MAEDGTSGSRETGEGLALPADKLVRYLDEVFPERNIAWPPIHIESLEPYEARLRMEFDASIVRPGGTISGPAMFMLADYGIYVAILGMIGAVPLAVTTNLTMNFLHRPLQRDLIAEVRLLKLGKRLAVGDAMLHSDGADAVVAHASGTYSIPPPDKR